MSPSAAQSLRDIVQEHGLTVCSTPSICRTLLSQRKTHANELHALVLAMDLGVVRELVSDPQRPRGQFVQKVATQGRIGAPAARWAVDTWAAVIAEASRKQPRTKNWNAVGAGTPHIVQPRGQRAAAMTGWALVILLAAFGGALPGLLLGWGLDYKRANVLDWIQRHGVSRLESPTVFALMYGGCGAAGAAAGALFGYLALGINQFSWNRLLGAAAGGLAGAADGALMGLAMGGGTGALIGAAVLAMVGTAFGGRLGAISLLWVGGRAASLVFEWAG